jgi:hypothetical protein
VNEEYKSNSTRRKPWISISVTISILIVVIGLMWTAMPKGFKMTHEEIGTGKPALVFIYNPNLVVNISQSEQMNKTRDLLGDRVFFLIAQIGTPEGDQLIAEHRANTSELLLFDRSGSLIKRQFALKSSNELIQWFAVGAP